MGPPTRPGLRRRRPGSTGSVQTLRLLFAVVAGLRAVFVYGEAGSLTGEPWALRQAERLLDALSWRPRPARGGTAVGEPARLA